MNNNLIAVILALLTGCFVVITYWLSGGNFERNPDLSVTFVLAVLSSICVGTATKSVLDSELNMKKESSK